MISFTLSLIIRTFTSQGYLCCKRRVLEFDEFLKIEGCKKGRHVFVPKKSDEEKVCLLCVIPPPLCADLLCPQNVEELVNCRIDHYQTPGAVHVSVFAKQADSSRSVVKFEQDQVCHKFVPVASKSCNFSIMSSRFTSTCSFLAPNASLVRWCSSDLSLWKRLASNSMEQR